MSERIITKIPALAEWKNKPGTVSVKKRVAAYARVSTEKEEQENSLEAQKAYFRYLIQSRPDWEDAGLYSDEGISGVSFHNREAFKQMIEDALAGKIDLILTKSLSRFARNTVDALQTIRSLKNAGVAVYFEKEDINTLDSKGELLITLMSSFAQEESRSISENIKWGIRKRFADGKYSVAYSSFLGYYSVHKDEMLVDEREARIVRFIYLLYLENRSFQNIADVLMAAGILTVTGKKKWFSSVVSSILHNEKYKGEALLQKGYTVDYLTKKTESNNGILTQYLVTGGHEAIVSAEVWQEVQDRRLRYEQRYPTVSVLSNLIYCGECNSAYGRKMFRAPQIDAGYYPAWRCNGRVLHKTGCHTPSVYEQELMNQIAFALRHLLQVFYRNIFALCKDILNNAKATEVLQEWETNGLPDLYYELDCLPIIISRIVVETDDRVRIVFRDGNELEGAIGLFTPGGNARKQKERKELHMIAWRERAAKRYTSTPFDYSEVCNAPFGGGKEQFYKQVSTLRAEGLGCRVISYYLGISCKSRVQRLFKEKGLTVEKARSEYYCWWCGAIIQRTPGARARLFCSVPCKGKYYYEKEKEKRLSAEEDYD